MATASEPASYYVNGLLLWPGYGQSISVCCRSFRPWWRPRRPVARGHMSPLGRRGVAGQSADTRCLRPEPIGRARKSTRRVPLDKQMDKAGSRSTTRVWSKRSTPSGTICPVRPWISDRCSMTSIDSLDRSALSKNSVCGSTASHTSASNNEST